MAHPQVDIWLGTASRSFQAPSSGCSRGYLAPASLARDKRQLTRPFAAVCVKPEV